ncbi:hypothetical protein D3C71_1964590 [compost metagenome]
MGRILTQFIHQLHHDFLAVDQPVRQHYVVVHPLRVNHQRARQLLRTQDNLGHQLNAFLQAGVKDKVGRAVRLKRPWADVEHRRHHRI